MLTVLPFRRCCLSWQGIHILLLLFQNSSNWSFWLSMDNKCYLCQQYPNTQMNRSQYWASLKRDPRWEFNKYLLHTLTLTLVLLCLSSADPRAHAECMWIHREFCTMAPSAQSWILWRSFLTTHAGTMDVRQELFSWLWTQHQATFRSSYRTSPHLHQHHSSKDARDSKAGMFSNEMFQNWIKQQLQANNKFAFAAACG